MPLNTFLHRSPVTPVALALCLFHAAVQAQEIESVAENDNEVSIAVREVTDAAQLAVTIADRPVDIIRSETLSNGSLSVDVAVPSGITPRYTTVSVTLDGTSIGSTFVNLSGRWEYPELRVLRPAGGVEGATITIVGTNLGSSTDRVGIWLEKAEQENGETVFRETGSVEEISISAPDENAQQELKFTIPAGRELAGDGWFSNPSRVRVSVNDDSSNYLSLKVVRSNWRGKTIFFTLTLIVGLLVLLGITIRKWTFWQVLFIEKKTNTYSNWLAGLTFHTEHF